MGARRARKQEVVVIEPDAEEAAAGAALPLFGDDPPDDITAVAISRLEPIDEGHLGVMPPETDQEGIRRRFGGGVFMLLAKSADGKIKRRRQITISGDPKLESFDARRRYAIKLQLDEGGPRQAAPPPPPPAPPPSALPEVLAIISQSHSAQMDMMRLQLQAAQQDAAERESRARREADEREQRLRREADERVERDRQFNASMVALTKGEAKSGALAPTTLVEMLMQGLQLGRKLSAGTEKSDPAVPDPVSSFVQMLPAILEKGARFFQAGKEQAAAAAAEAPGGGRVYLSGELAVALRAAVGSLVGKGYSRAEAGKAAELTIARAVEVLAQAPNRPTTEQAPPAAAPAPAPQPNGAAAAAAPPS